MVVDRKCEPEVYFSNSGLWVWQPPNLPGFYYVRTAGGWYRTVSGHLSEVDS